MRQTISGLVAAFAVVIASAAPAVACGGGLFSPCVQSYVPVYSGCNSGCGGWAYERLPDPVQQYYYVNQGPTYTGPGNFAPYPTYREGAVSGWGAYRHDPYYYGYSAAPRPYYRRWHGYAGYHYGHAYRHSLRYGYHGMPHRYGYAHTRRYY